MDETRGFYLKYQVRHADGSELSPGMVFVLRPDRDPAAWDALRMYALSTLNRHLGEDLRRWLTDYPRPKGGTNAEMEWEQKIEAAYEMVFALCQPRGTSGAREWMMSIPARPDYDPDMVIAAGLRAARDEIERLRTVCEEALELFEDECTPDEPDALV